MIADAPARYRDAAITRLITSGILTDPAWHDALRDLPRDRFVTATYAPTSTVGSASGWLRSAPATTPGPPDGRVVAERLTALKATTRQLTARRDELAADLQHAPTAPDPATLNDVAEHLAEIIASGSPNQRKALVEALVARVTITGPDRLVPVFRVPQPGHDEEAAPAQSAGTAPNAPVRTPTDLVGRVGFEPTT